MQYPETKRIPELAAPILGDQKLHGRGIAALEAQQYRRAVQLLEQYLKQIQFSNAKPHTHIALARAYWGNRQRKDAINLCNHLVRTGDKATRRWAQRFLAATRTHPKALDPLVTENRLRNQKAALSVDVTDKLIILAVHLSVYGGIVLSSWLPGRFWLELFESLIQQGVVTPELIQPIGLMVLPVLLPLGLLFFSRDQVVTAHGREVLNYWITMLLIVTVRATGGALLARGQLLLAEYLPLVLNLLKVAVTVVSLSYLVAPVVAIAWLLIKPDRFFRYPFILRLL